MADSDKCFWCTMWY